MAGEGPTRYVTLPLGCRETFPDSLPEHYRLLCLTRSLFGLNLAERRWINGLWNSETNKRTDV